MFINKLILNLFINKYLLMKNAKEKAIKFEEEDLPINSNLLFKPSNSVGSVFTSINPNDDTLTFSIIDNLLKATIELKNSALKSIVAYYVFII